MPRHPVFLARRFDRRGVRCVVTAIEDASPRFRRVHLAGDGPRGHGWQPCQVTSFRMSPTEFRYLSGHGQTIQWLRAALRDRHGVPKTAIRTQPYWATGRAGL